MSLSFNVLYVCSSAACVAFVFHIHISVCVCVCAVCLFNLRTRRVDFLAVRICIRGACDRPDGLSLFLIFF